MTSLSPVERLRAAADTLDRLDQAATPGPWHSAPNVHGDPRVCTDPLRPSFTSVCEVNTRPDDYGKANRDLIATLRPIAGLVAVWLRTEAEALKSGLLGYGWLLGESNAEHEARFLADHAHALAVAEAVLATAVTEVTS